MHVCCHMGRNCKSTAVVICACVKVHSNCTSNILVSTFSTLPLELLFIFAHFSINPLKHVQKNKDMVGIGYIYLKHILDVLDINDTLVIEVVLKSYSNYVKKLWVIDIIQHNTHEFCFLLMQIRVDVYVVSNFNVIPFYRCVAHAFKANAHHSYTLMFAEKLSSIQTWRQCQCSNHTYPHT